MPDYDVTETETRHVTRRRVIRLRASCVSDAEAAAEYGQGVASRWEVLSDELVDTTYRGDLLPSETA